MCLGTVALLPIHVVNILTTWQPYEIEKLVFFSFLGFLTSTFNLKRFVAFSSLWYISLAD